MGRYLRNNPRHGWYAIFRMETKVKICGITSLEDALCAAREGASFLGYIFYPPSKRFIAPRSAREITQAIRADFPHVQHVGVFVDEEPENLAWTANLADRKSVV